MISWSLRFYSVLRLISRVSIKWKEHADSRRPRKKKRDGEKERERERERGRREDAEQFYSYTILRDTYIASPLAMPSRLTHPIHLMHMNTGTAFPSSTLVINVARRIQKRTKGRGGRKTENLCRKEPAKKQAHIDIFTLKCKGRQVGHYATEEARVECGIILAVGPTRTGTRV